MAASCVGAAAPVPVTVIEVTAGDALWLKLSVPLRVPTSVGVNVTISVQCASGASAAPATQFVAAIVNSAGEGGSPSTKKSANTSGALPVLVNVKLKPGETAPMPVAGSVIAVPLKSAIGAALAGSNPVPVSAMLETAGDALCAIVMVALLMPVALGLNCSVSVQFAPGANIAPALHDEIDVENSVLARVNDAMFSVLVPVLVSVTVWLGAHAPTIVPANATALDETLTTGVPAGAMTPVPDNEIVLVDGDALWLIVIKPVRAPAADGVKPTLSRHVPLAARLSPAVQVLLITVNSAPVTVVVPKTRGTVPVLVSVTDCADAVVATLVDAKLSAVLDNDAAGAPTVTVTPVPDKVTRLAAGVAL